MLTVDKRVFILYLLDRIPKDGPQNINCHYNDCQITMYSLL